MNSYITQRSTLTGWSLTLPSLTNKVTVPIDKVSYAVSDYSGFIVRGAGRSYGDCASLSHGHTLELANKSISIDSHGILLASANATVGDILEHSVPLGWFLPVTPGTSYATLGGLVAADAHGKNHHKNGSLGEHLIELTMVDASGTALVASRTAHTDLFRATIGGMGLTGVILQVSLKMLKIETSLMEVTSSKHSSIGSMLEAMLQYDNLFDYSVAWVDMSTYGTKAGRGLLFQGKHMKSENLPDANRDKPLAYCRPPIRAIPLRAPVRIITRTTTFIFNKLWYHKFYGKTKVSTETLNKFFYPLDGVTNWNKVYRKGVLQYQFVIPHHEVGVLEKTVQMFIRDKCPIFLVVLKQMGQAGEGLLSFPAKGWTLAVDIPADHAGILELLDKIDDMVASAGGRVYLAKDSRIDHRFIPGMYPKLPMFKDAKNRYDPERKLISDMSQRLQLC